MAQESSPPVHLLSWCGMALVAAGMLMVVATLLHPSQETAATIIASEVGLVAAHFVYTLAWLLVLLGLPGLYVSQRGGMGRLGLIGVLDCLRRYVSDRRHRKLRVLCPGPGEGGAGECSRRDRPVLAGCGHQWVGCNHCS